MWQFSYPPANGASVGNYFLPKGFFLLVKLATSLLASLAGGYIFFRMGEGANLESRTRRHLALPRPCRADSKMGTEVPGSKFTKVVSLLSCLQLTIS